MDELINKFISKKLRKKGEAYRLSENSRLTAQDFGQLSTIASKIYQYLASISPRQKTGTTFNQLVALLRYMRNRDVALSAKEASVYTHVNTLDGFSFNKRASWSGVIPWRPQFFFDVDRSEVKIMLPPHKNWFFTSFPERFSRVGITFHVLVIDLANLKEQRTAHTSLVFISPPDDGKSLSTTLQCELFTDSLIIVIGKAQYYRFSTTEAGDKPSGQAPHNATDILATYHVRKGKLLENNPSAHTLSPSPGFNPDGGSKWE